MKSLEEYKLEPTFPYNLPSFNKVNINPLDELWCNDKPYLYIGCSSGPRGDYTWIWDILENKQITFRYFDCFKVTIDGTEVQVGTAWADKYIQDLPSYKWLDRSEAKSHGVKFNNPVHLVIKFNNDFGLFRYQKGGFRTIYFPVLQYIDKQISLF